MNALSAWLDDLGLARYAAAFAAEDIALDVLPELDEADLKALGVASLGDRKRLLKAIAALRTPAPTPAQDTPAPRVQEAERRQLTVMFCDMVGSTVLSNRLDPEDLQSVIRSFHQAVTSSVAPYEGHVAQLLGDGVLVYFGYPRAHEDDAERAVRAALAALGAVARLRPLGDIVLQTRIGIATGRVVVGEIGAGTPAAERTASGETPNLAARLQAAAGPGEIVLSDETRRLVRASFEMRSLGALNLKGFTAPVEAWRVMAERSVASRFEAQHDSELIDLVGRDSEVSLLLERWALACDGEGQVVMLAGEAGIGKSRITHTLRERLAGQSAATVLLQCSPYFSNSALYPAVQYFERVSGMTPADSEATRIEKLAQLTGSELEFPAASFGYMLRLMGLPDGGRVPADGGAVKHDNSLLLQAPIDLLRGLSRHHPVLLLIEDAHWIDPTTAELVAQAIEQLGDARVLVLITCRPEYAPSWGNPAHLTRLTLNRLGQRQCAALVAAVTGGKALPPEVLAEIIRKTDGIPLFVEELTKTVLQSGLLEDGGDAGWRLTGPLPALAIPSTLQDSLMARLDRLAPAKEVAQVSALIGREFSRRLLAAVLHMPDAQLDAALDDLVRAELVVRRDAGPNASYSFKHALIRDTASNSMLKSQWVLRHGQIAAVIEATEPETAAAQPELLAHHYQEGGQPARAFEHWRRAGDLAASHLALREASSHYRAALALLAPLEERPERKSEELELQMKLGSLLMQIDGYGAAQTIRSFDRGRELAQALGQIDVFVLACAGLGATLWAQGRFRDVIEMQAHVAPEDVPRLKPMSRVFRSVVLGLAEFHLGHIDAAWSHTRDATRELEAIEGAERQDIGGVDPAVIILAQSISIGVHRGLLDSADAWTSQALAIAERRDHEPTRAWAVSLARWRAFRHGDAAQSVRLARESLALSERLGFQARIATGQMMLGRALVGSGELEPGRRLLHDGFAQWRASGSVATGSEYASQAAEVLLHAGCTEDAAAFVRAGEQLQRDSEERYFEAELLRQRGRLAELGVALDAADAASSARERAEQHYRRAIDVAETQGASWFALRAALDLARSMRAAGRGAEAQALLRPLEARFSEGLDAPELLAARALLG
jgi:class 3 adenylate cyclase